MHLRLCLCYECGIVMENECGFFCILVSSRTISERGKKVEPNEE